jgi:hypothetical protein
MEGDSTWVEVSHRVLDEAASALGDTRRGRISSSVVLGEWSGCRFRIEHHAGGGGDYPAAKPEQQISGVLVRKRWADRRVNIRRGKKELTGQRQFDRLEAKLAHLEPHQQSTVLEALTELPGPLLLKRSRMWTQLPFVGSSGADIADRVKAMAEYLNRLSAGRLR